MTSEEFTIFRGASFASTMVRRVRCLLGSPTLPRPSLFILVIISIAQSTLGDCERCCKEEDYGNATDTCFYASQLSRVPALHSCCGIDPAKRSWCCPLFTDVDTVQFSCSRLAMRDCHKKTKSELETNPFPTKEETAVLVTLPSLAFMIESCSTCVFYLRRRRRLVLEYNRDVELRISRSVALSMNFRNISRQKMGPQVRSRRHRTRARKPFFGIPEVNDTSGGGMSIKPYTYSSAGSHEAREEGAGSFRWKVVDDKEESLGEGEEGHVGEMATGEQGRPKVDGPLRRNVIGTGPEKWNVRTASTGSEAEDMWDMD